MRKDTIKPDIVSHFEICDSAVEQIVEDPKLVPIITTGITCQLRVIRHAASLCRIIIKIDSDTAVLNGHTVVLLFGPC
jgi:hypothetical protein